MMHKKFLLQLIIFTVSFSQLTLSFADEQQNVALLDDQEFDVLFATAENVPDDTGAVCKDLITSLRSLPTVKNWIESHPKYHYRRKLKQYLYLITAGIGVVGVVLLLDNLGNKDDEYSNNINPGATMIGGSTVVTVGLGSVLEAYIYNMKLLVNGSSQCIVDQASCDEEYKSYAQKVTKDKHVDLQRFSQNVQEKISEFCTIKINTKKRPIIKLMSLGKIKTTLRQAYRSEN